MKAESNFAAGTGTRETNLGWLNNGAGGEPNRCNLFNFYVEGNTMAKKKSIVRQAVERLLSMAAFGDSKHADKIANGGKPARDKINASKTMDNYIDVAGRFVRWARKIHGCRMLQDAQQFMPAYLSQRIEQGKSAWTVRLEASALAKMYGCGINDFGVALPQRQRQDVTQHRQDKWIGHFDPDKNKELMAFGKATGLRRHEMAAVTPEDVWEDGEGQVIVHVVQGKGGKERFVETLNDTPLMLARKARNEGKKRIFDSIHKYAPVHEWRAEFARETYRRHARPLEEIPLKERYICRKDKVGEIYDKKAMAVSSQRLGHGIGRLDVIALSYL